MSSDDTTIIENTEIRVREEDANSMAVKFAEKEKEWREKEKEYVGDLLKQTKELQRALSLAEGERRARSN